MELGDIDPSHTLGLARESEADVRHIAELQTALRIPRLRCAVVLRWWNTGRRYARLITPEVTVTSNLTYNFYSARGTGTALARKLDSTAAVQPCHFSRGESGEGVGGGVGGGGGVGIGGHAHAHPPPPPAFFPFLTAGACARYVATHGLEKMAFLSILN